MKIKDDFVTNSSSTAFIFIFEGTSNKDLFRKMVLDHGEDFKISYDEYDGTIHEFDAWDLSFSIYEKIKKSSEDPYYLPEVRPLQHLIDTLDNEIKENQEGYDKYMKKNDSFSDYYRDTLETLTKAKARAEIFKKNHGKYSYLEVDFGNDGIIQGALGYAMESDGRDIDIDTDTFYIYSESHH